MKKLLAVLLLAALFIPCAPAEDVYHLPVDFPPAP